MFMYDATAVLYASLLIIIYSLSESFVFAFLPRIFRRKKDLKGQKILITGAGSNLGRQLAVEFSKHSVHLVLLDINRESLVDTEKLLDGQSSVFSYKCDVSDKKKVYETAEQIKKDVEEVDVIVNCADIVHGKYLMDLPDEQIVKTIEVNVLANFWIVKSFLPAMMIKNKGHIMFVASTADRIIKPKLTDYCASKFAAAGFAECLGMELQEKKLDGIKVSVICPSDIGLFDGAKATSRSKMTPEYIARKAVIAVQQE